MKVTKSIDATTPKYPSSKQFQRSRAIMGVAAIGLGTLVTGCTTRYEDKYSTTTGGIPSVEPRPPATIVTGGEMRVEPAARTKDYKVRPGDTLYSIAKKALGKGSRWRDIVALNTGLAPSTLKAGQTIRLPVVAP